MPLRLVLFRFYFVSVRLLRNRLAPPTLARDRGAHDDASFEERCPGLRWFVRYIVFDLPPSLFDSCRAVFVSDRLGV